MRVFFPLAILVEDLPTVTYLQTEKKISILNWRVMHWIAGLELSNKAAPLSCNIPLESIEVRREHTIH